MQEKKELTGEEVDLIGEAYENARAEGVQLKPGYLKVIAPAKVNLHLAVGERRSDGYHPVQNVMHALLLHDILYMRRMSAEAFAFEVGSLPENAASPETPNLKIHLTCAGVGSVQVPEVEPEANIAFKAVVALAKALGRDENEVVDVHIEKHIPHQAGLGGGSTDAAAALVGAARLWGIDASDPRIVQVAQKLGSDVSFFLQGGCALFTGAGEIYDRSLTPRKDALVLIKPEGGLSTAAVYQAFDATPDMVSPEDAAALEAATAATEVPLFNGLEKVAGQLDATLATIRAWAAAQPGVAQVMLTGSGSCTFAICENSQAAYALAAAAQAQGWWASATYLQNVRACVVG